MTTKICKNCGILDSCKRKATNPAECKHRPRLLPRARVPGLVDLRGQYQQDQRMRMNVIEGG